MLCTQFTGKTGLFFFLNQGSPEIFNEKIKCQFLMSTKISIYIFQYYFNNKTFSKNSLNLEIGYKSSNDNLFFPP